MAARLDTWYAARKAPFEAFGILYYPLFLRHDDLSGIKLDDSDMTWAMTANANLEGTGYTLSQPSILSLAACHHRMAALAASTGFLPVTESMGEKGVNPLADIQRLVPNVTADPMYPDFPSQVMEMDEATFRYHQAMHYVSTYGVELVAGLLGLDVEVGQGWLPHVESTPKTREDETLLPSKVLHLILTVEDLSSVVEARLARATRMHPAEIESALLVFEDLSGDEDVSFPKVAFHENMMELIRTAAQGSSSMLARVAGGLAQHPGDLLKAVLYLVEANKKSGKCHLKTRQKKGFCRAFERFPVMNIAHNIADAGKKERRAPNYLSIERFAGPHLREACQLVWSGEVVSWQARTEQLWDAVRETMMPEPEPVDRALSSHKTRLPERLRDAFARLIDKGRGNVAEETVAEAEPQDKVAEAWKSLLAHYGQRPGVLFRSFTRLLKGGCPYELLEAEALAHAGRYSLPTLVRTLTIMSEKKPHYRLGWTGFATHTMAESADKEFDENLVSLLRALLMARLRGLETPIAGKRVHLDTAGISLTGSILMPNDNGNTGTAWPPVGMAYDLPDDQIVRFFTFWDERKRRVDVDLHFVGVRTDGSEIKIGWNSKYQGDGLVTSGDITSSQNAVEYLDAHMGKARESGVILVAQVQHIYCGAQHWSDISTCYSGAMVVGDTSADVKLYDAQNLLFRDDLTGAGTRMSYAIVNFPGHYVRIMRGADLPAGDVGFALGDYLVALLEAQDATLVADSGDADVRICVGRSDDSEVVSLFDEGFFL